MLWGACSPAPSRPNVIVVLADTLRRDYLGVYGFDGAISPHIDHFAQDAVVFDRAFAPAPWTKPSVASLFTALPPPVHRVQEIVIDRAALPTTEAEVLPLSLLTLAEAFQKAGYQTAGFTANPWIRSGFGFEQGFDVYEDDAEEWKDSVRLFDRAKEWLSQRDGSKPFFLYLHLMDSHSHYLAGESNIQKALSFKALQSGELMTPADLKHHYFRQAFSPAFPRAKEEGELKLDFYKAVYAASVMNLDRNFGRFINTLKEKGLYRETAIIFLSDHGEQLGEKHGEYGDHIRHWMHSFYLFEPLIRVPLIIKYPGGLRFPGRRGDFASLLDIFPTLSRLCGLDAAPVFPFGRDLNKEFFAGLGFGGPVRVRAYFKEDAALREKKWKMILKKDEKPWLYQLREDPLETVNERENHSQVADRLEKSIRKEKEALAAIDVKASPHRPLPPETVEKLRALGYLQ